MNVPLSTEGEPIDFTAELAPGVLGYAIEEDGILWIPDVRAAVEGDGRVGKFLDALPTDRTIRFPTVISVRLAGMLVRRSFVNVEMEDDGFGMHLAYFERLARAPGAAR